MNIKIADNLIFFTLLRVISGKEESLYDEIESFKKDYNTNIGILKGFGRYDVIVVIKANSLNLLNCFRKNITNFIYECYPLIVFNWINEKKQEGHDEQLDFQDTIYGLTLIKLNGENIQIFGMKNELKLIENFLNLNNTKVFGGIGYHEIILLTSSSTFDEFEKKINEIENVVSSLENYVLDIHTLPMYNYNFIFEKENMKLNQNAENLEVATLLNLNRCCFTENSLEILKEFDKTFKITYGYHNLILEKSGPLNKILENILNLRKNLSDENYFPSSFTLIKRKRTPDVFKKEIDLGFNLKLENLIKIDKNHKGPTKYLINIYNQLIQNPYTENLFHNDMKEFFTDILPSLRVREEDYYYRNKKIEYNMLIKVLTYSIIQRISGVYLGDLLASSLINFENYGSVNRLIYALEAYPKYFSLVSNRDFNGFCCVGFDDRYCSYTGNIYNIPRKIIFNIEEWWGILHEIFHSLEIEVKSDKPISFLNSPQELKEEFYKKRKKLFKYSYDLYMEDICTYVEPKDDLKNIHEIFKPLFWATHGHKDDEFIYETIPSVLDFYIGWCPDKRDLHYEKLGKYLLKEFNLSTSEYYLARLAFVRVFEIYQFKEEFLHNGDTFTYEELEEHLKNFFNQLEGILDLEIDEETKNEAISITLTYQNLAKFFVEYFHKIKIPRSEKNNKETIKKSILEGGLDLTIKYNPLDILHSIFEIEKEGEFTIKNRIVAFLYLYNYRIKNDSE